MQKIVPIRMEEHINYLIGAFNAGPYYASDEKITPIRAGVKRALKVIRSKQVANGTK